MRKIKRTIILSGLLGLLFLQSAGAFELDSKKFMLDNGMEVIITEMPSSPMVSVYGLVRTGSAREGKFIGTGISHYLEHMLFKGTHGREVGEIAGQVQAVGGSINASTSHDFTIYTINVPYDHFDLALDILTDMLFNAKIDAEEVEKERTVILAEMRMIKDNPDRWIGSLTFKNAYRQHPYGYPVIGYAELFNKVSREDLWEYYKKHYSPNNTIISIAGHINTEEAEAKVRAKLSSLPRESTVMDVVPTEPRQSARRELIEEYPTDLARLSLAYQGVDLLDEDLYAMDVLAQIIGQGESSRLYQDIYKDKNLVYSIGASNFTPIDPGLFEVEALLDQKNIEAVRTAIFAHVANVKTQPVTEQELKKAKRQVLSSYVQGNQKTSSVAWHQALDEAFAGDHRFSFRYIEKIKKVNAEDIQRVAKKYLNDDQLSVTVLLPPSGAKALAEKKVQEPAEIEKHELANGLTVLLRQDKSFPLVSMQLFLKGGQLVESDGYWGLSQLMANVWTKGTKSRTAKEIAEETESLGMGLGAYAGKNSFGINMSMLAEDTERALTLLEDIVKNPTFPQDEIDLTKKDMLTALIQRDENVSSVTSYLLRQRLYKTHPYAQDGLGTAESLALLSRDHLEDYYKYFTKPNNMVLSVFGDIDPRQMLASIEKKFGALKKAKVDFKSYPVPEIVEPEEVQQVLNKEQAMVMVGYPGVTIANEDRYGLEILEAVLGSSFNGRLFIGIREKLGKAYTMGGGSVPGLDPGYIFFYVLTEPNSVDVVRTMIFEEIAKLQNEIVPQKEFDDIKTYLKGSYKADLETNSSLAFSSGLDELYGLGYENYKVYEAMIDRISAARIQELANKYLRREQSVTIITQPEKDDADGQ